MILTIQAAWLVLKKRVSAYLTFGYRAFALKSINPNQLTLNLPFFLTMKRPKND